MKVQINTWVGQFLTSQLRRTSLHKVAAARRKLAGNPRELHYFHQVADPYSHLMVQVLPELVARFGLVLRPHVIGEIRSEMLPEPEMFDRLGPKDAHQIARLYGLDFPNTYQRAAPKFANDAGMYLAGVAQLQPSEFCDEAIRIGAAYWSGGNEPTDWTAFESESNTFEAGEKLLAKFGHYLPGILHFEGESYWGVDRLDHLEMRLIKDGLGEGPAVFTKTWEGVFDPLPSLGGIDLPPLELFFSARSPYSYISIFQARRFADAVGVDLILRPVLPMVMRNMKVPFRKRLYIVTDAKREADKAGLPFGKIADPLGVGVERVYAIGHWVEAQHSDQLEAYFRSALTGIAAQAIDVATDAGLRKIVELAGLEWAQAGMALDRTEWKAWVQSNRDTMTQNGLWGVPSLKFGEITAWGQDRFWVIRQEIMKQHKKSDKSM